MSPLCSSRGGIAPFFLLLLFFVLAVGAAVAGSAAASASTRRLLDSDEKLREPKKTIASDEHAPPKLKTVGGAAMKSKKVNAPPIEEKSGVKVKKVGQLGEEKGDMKVKKAKALVNETSEAKVKKLKNPNPREEKLGGKFDKEQMKKPKKLEGESEEKPNKIKAIEHTKTSEPKNITHNTIPPKNQTKLINSKPFNQTKPTNPTKLASKIPKSPSITKPPIPKEASKDKTKAIEQKKTNPPKPQKPPTWLENDDDDSDFVSQIKSLPSKFNQILPDIQKISSASKTYLTRANKEMTKGIKPIVGNKHASTIASLVLIAFLIIPIIISFLIFHHITAFFSLQKIIIFVQAYLAIYFWILSLSYLVAGIEPLTFFFTLSKSTYMCVTVLQTLAYGLYLLVLMMYLVLVFSTETTLGSKGLGLAQTVLGFAVGVHFYVAVVHRVASHQVPQSNWRVHGVYGVCFAGLCGLAALEKRKKAYLEESGQEGKRN